MEQRSSINNQWLYIFIALAIALNFSGLFVTIIEPDGALYASIAKTMVWKSNYADLFVNGQEWLDKPHFPFWAAALSFKIFGINTWAYKLPAILFVMMGAWYTYKFALQVYNKQIALWSVLILLTAQHLVISNNDVRAEPYLTGLIIASVYYFYKAQGQRWFWNIILGALFAACAVMTKGIFAVIPVAGAIFGHLIITKQWKLMFHARWLLAIVAGCIFILPELWCLYMQFDIHPEKVVFGRTNVSGLKFFFWDSQFGRFFNDGPIKKANGDPSFFLHTTLWAFLPWSILLYIGIVQFFRNKGLQVKHKEWYSICGAGLTFLIFSLSKFQLPHYITIIFPFFAILTAQYFYGLDRKSEQVIKFIQLFIITVMVLIIGLLHYFFKPENTSVLMLAILVATVALGILVCYRIQGRYQILYMTCVAAFFVNLYFNLAFYPKLVQYQADSMAAFYINTHNTARLPVIQIENGTSYAMDFYLNQTAASYVLEGQEPLPKGPYLLFGDKDAIDQLKQKGLVVQPIKSFERFRITLLKKKFLNSATRQEVVQTSELVLVK
jgi:4-amino-4-deoxy-L-arabinose transferase-like glycosyltransferase